MSQHRDEHTQAWVNDGPRGAQGLSGVGWPIGAASRYEAEHINAIGMERETIALPPGPWREPDRIGLPERKATRR